MNCILNHWKNWIDAPRKLRATGMMLAFLAALILFSGLFLTAGDRQIRAAADSHYAYSTAVSDAVRTYTHSCEILAASRNVRALSELNHVSEKNASFLANQVIQDIWNINTVLPDTSNIAVLFPKTQLAVTKNQYRFSVDFSPLLSSTFSGLSYEQLLSQDSGSWHNYYADGMCYVVRSLQEEGLEGHILVNFSVEAVMPEMEGSITVVGDSGSCLYTSTDRLPDNFYDSLLSALNHDRKISIGGKSYYIIRNVFSNLSICFFTLVPLLTRTLLTIRIASFLLFFLLLAAAELMLYFHQKRRAAEPKKEEKADAVVQYTLSGMAKTLLDLPEGRGIRISQQCYNLLKLSAAEDCAVIGFTLLLDQERLFDDETPVRNGQRSITPYFILSNMLQDLLYDRHIGELCYCSDKFIALSNLCPGETEADLQNIAQQVISAAKNYLNLTFVASEPAVSHGCGQFHATLLRTSQQLDHARLWWQSEELRKVSTQAQNGLDFYKHLTLLNACISENNYVKAEEEFNRILQCHIPKSVEQVQEAASRLSIVLDSVISLTDYPRSLLPDQAIPPKTIAACQELGTTIFRTQLAAQNSTSVPPSKERIAAITKYVAENYSDPELGVGTIAIQMGMNAAYLSRAFKVGTGINLLEYIHRTRIAAAKDLLPQYSIKEVSTKVGFTDVQSFSRTFRKYESVTPVEYKRNCTPSNSSLPN